MIHQGTIAVGDALKELETGHTRVVGIEFHTSPSLGEDSCTLVLERRDDLEIHPGSVLEAASE